MKGVENGGGGGESYTHVATHAYVADLAYAAPHFNQKTFFLLNFMILHDFFDCFVRNFPLMDLPTEMIAYRRPQRPF